ncbi:MAG: hypothetical protein KGK08_04060 [Acidobacteriota bacterium]|nr:hypothetical protein [Acidobacteriota bacterium]
MTRDRFSMLLLPAVALIAVLPLVVHGCSCGHDFDFHLLNWLEAARQFRHGNLYPQWAFSAAWNAGEPRFVFYPPASWTLGALLGTLFGFAAAPVLYTWLVLTAAGVAMYHLARGLVASTPALVAAVLYAVNPYMLFTALERTAYAELLAAALLPLLLAGILRPQLSLPRLAMPLAALWLCNVPAAIIGSYGLALLAMSRLAFPGLALSQQNVAAPSTCSVQPTWVRDRVPQASRLVEAARGVLATLLGLGLAAFYLLPAIREQRFVQIHMATLPGMRVQDNFLFQRTGNTPDQLLHDQVLHTASAIAVGLLAVTAALLWLAWHRVESPAAPHPQQPLPRAQRPLLASLALVTAVVALLLTPLSLPLWQHLPRLGLLQFPWRLLCLQASVAGLALALVLQSVRLSRLRATVGALLLATLLAWSGYRSFHQPCDDEDTVAAQLAAFRQRTGSEPTDEYTPVAADNDALAATNPGYWLAASAGQPAPAGQPAAPAPLHLTVAPDSPCWLILNLRAYPAWRVLRNGQPVTVSPTARPDGLLALPLPAGRSHLDIEYTELPGHRLGAWVSLLSLCLLAALCWPSRRRRNA